MTSAAASIDRLIERVESLDVNSSAACGAASVSSSQDYAWQPRVPPGHTSFSWTGTYGHPPYKIPVDTKKEKGSKAAKAQMSNSAAAETKTNSDDSSALGEQMQLFSRLDFRVGKIVSVSKHPDAESLYIEHIDVGEKEPREIVSGLVKYIPEDKMLNSTCIVFVNLKANKLRGVLSNGMVLCAKNEEGTVVEFIQPPQGTAVGDRLIPKGLESVFKALPVDDSVNTKKKTNAWTPCMGLLSTNAERVACFNNVPLHTSTGACTAATLSNASIS